jgi:uncharacterized membrane protein
MKTFIQLAILVAASSVFMALHEMLCQTWQPMFWLIILSSLIALIPAFLLFRAANRSGISNWKRIFVGTLAVPAFIIVWNVCWAISEEALIHYYVATYGYDDTGGRYFYPGNSGMGYADGLGRPLHTLLQTLGAAGIGSVILGLPLGILSTKNQKATKPLHPTAGNAPV